MDALEELHRAGVLVPFYRVRLENGDPAQTIDLSHSFIHRFAATTVPMQLFLAARDGRVTDPAHEPFEPWPTERRRTTWPTFEWSFLYSYHQLLGLRRALWFVNSLRPGRADNAITWHLDPGDLPSQETAADIAGWRSLAIVLSAIDTVYWPDVMHELSYSMEGWREVRLSFDPAETLSWLGVSADEVSAQADSLRLAASGADILGDLLDVVRRAKPTAWLKMRGPALTEMEDRVAAEMLHLVEEEINGLKTLTPMGPPLSQQWLGERRNSLDAALNTMQLSPHPSVVVAVEGETELLLLPRVFELLDIRNDPNFIRIECFGGTKKDLALMARFASAPHIGIDRGDFVELDRPVTHFVVLTDAENKYATVADRRKQRLLLMESIAYGVPEEFRADLYGKPARMVEIRTWGKAPFEFAHFTDGRLADAILQTSTKQYPRGRTALLTAIKMQRNSPAPNIEKAWKQSGVNKLDLAEATWPFLERRIKSAIARQQKGPPIMQGALRAYEIGIQTHGLNMSLRRRPGWLSPKL